MFLVVSNCKAFTETWKTLLRSSVGDHVMAQTSNSLAEAVAAAENIRLALAIVDGSQLGKNALRTDGELAHLAKRTRLLLVESSFDPGAELVALTLGIAGCCAAQLSDAELRKIVDVVLKGGIWVSRSALPDLLSQLRRVVVPAPESESEFNDKLGNLTPREREIALCIAEGATNKVIAKRLGISDVTIKSHLTSIFHKIGVSGRVQLALLLSGRPLSASLPKIVA